MSKQADKQPPFVVHMPGELFHRFQRWITMNTNYVLVDVDADSSDELRVVPASDLVPRDDRED